MESWEFLLQKEGDRSWRTLKTGSVEIMEGRYRVAAQASRANMNVEIRVNFQAIGENPPKRRFQKRSHRTNKEGLMVVIPFTNLKPGLWELNCSSGMMSDFLGQHWRQGIQLYVLPKSVETSPIDSAEVKTTTEIEVVVPDSELSDVETNLDTPKALPAASETLKEAIAEEHKFVAQQVAPTNYSTDAVTPVNPILERSLQNIDQFLEQVIEPLLEDFDASKSSKKVQNTLNSSNTEASLLSGEPADHNLPPLQLTLHQEVLVAQRGQSLTLSGQVDIQQSGITQSNFNLPVKGSLQISLHDPQNARILLDVWQPLPEQAPPLAFTCNLEVPLYSQSSLILGEVTLYNAAKVALASQPFSITVDLEGLLGAVRVQTPEDISAAATSFDTEEDLFSFSSEPTLTQEAKPVSIKLPQPSQSLQPPLSQSLPPQSYQFTSTEKTSKPKPLQLPKLPKPLTSPLAPPLPPPQRQVEGKEQEQETEQKLDSSAIVSEVAPSEPQLASEVLVNSETDIQPPEAAVAQPVEGESIVAEDAFQALKLPDRFWTRLNSLAADAELSEWLNSDLLPLDIPLEAEEALSPQAEVQEEIDTFQNPFELETSTEIPIHLPSKPVGTSVDWTNLEIVVDDDLPTPQQPTSEPQLDNSFQQNQLLAKLAISSMPMVEHTPVPTPEILVPAGELISGELIAVRVKLPPHSEAICIKLWVQDRQSRFLLDGPRFLADFLPNESGTLETMVQLTVPFGSVEIVFEAIAINTSTQGESHKVTVDRIVVPPDVLGLYLDEFEP